MSNDEIKKLNEKIEKYKETISEIKSLAYSQNRIAVIALHGVDNYCELCPNMERGLGHGIKCDGKCAKGLGMLANEIREKCERVLQDV